MIRSTWLCAALVVSIAAAASESAAAVCPDQTGELELCRFRPHVMAPALVAESFLPTDDLGTRWVGGGLQLVLYGWSDNSARPGPGQGSLFSQFSLLGTSDGDGHLFLLRTGANLSFERSAARRWVIPYYGFALGAMLHDSLGSRGFVDAVLGAYLFHSRYVVAAVEGGYLLPFSEIEKHSGIQMQLSVRVVPW